MKQLRKRLTYANVMSSIAVFVVLGGAAVAASQLPKNSVGKKQLKANAVVTAKIKKNAVTTNKIKKGAVTGVKVKNDSLTGTQINESTLGTVPSAGAANTAGTASVANSLAGHHKFSFFMGTGTKDVLTIGSFIIRADCVINNGGTNEAELLLLTTVDDAAYDDEESNEESDFDVEDNPIILSDDTSGVGNDDTDWGINFFAVAPSGVAISGSNFGLGLSVAGRPDQCYFTGLVEQTS